MDAPVPAVEIRPDDLTGEATRALVAFHLAGMRGTSPACSVHALDIDALRHPSVAFWSAWVDGEIAGIGALKALDAEGTPRRRGEVKSMRAADAFRGRGIGRALLDRIMDEARTRGFDSLWLETGSGAEFAAAQRLYERAGFARCGPFGDYTDDPFSTFFTRAL